jgi:hypothetical protein
MPGTLRTIVDEGDEMNPVRIAGETHEAKLGSIELSVQERETVNVPMWAGVGAIAIGGALLLLGAKKR